MVIIGTGGFEADDITADGTPAMWRLFRDGSSAVMTVRSPRVSTCPVDGWLSLSAGAPAGAPRSGAADNPSDRPCPFVVEPTPTGAGGATVPDWTAYVQETSATTKATLGILGEALTAKSTCVQAIGPGAAIAAADRRGAVTRYAPFKKSELLTDLSRCPVTVVDVGAARGPNNLPAGESSTGTKEQQLAAIDTRIGQVIDAGPLGADYLVLSMSDGATVPRLRIAIARGPRFGPGLLESSSTRQPGLIQAADITATALWLERSDIPAEVVGRPLTVDAAPDGSQERALARHGQLIDLAVAAQRAHSVVERFFWVYGATTLAFFGLAWLLWTRLRPRLAERTRVQVLDAVEFLALWTAAVPAGTFFASLVPWWQMPWALPSVVLAVGCVAFVIALIAARGPWRAHPTGAVGVVAALTMATIAADVVTGSRLQLVSIMGLQPVGGGRFYGMGNVAFALFATATLLVIAIIAGLHLIHRRRTRALLIVLGIGTLAVIIDGAPMWGADAGGPPALVAGLAVLVYAVRGRALTWRRALLVAGVGVGVVAAIAVADFARPVTERTHLGDFVQRVIDGQAWEVVADKARANLTVLSGADQPLAPLVPVVIAILLYAVLRPESRIGRPLTPLWASSRLTRAGVLAVLVTLVIGMLINDSGVAVAAAAAPLLLPLLIALRVRLLHHDERAVATTRAGRRGRRRRPLPPLTSPRAVPRSTRRV